MNKTLKLFIVILLISASVLPVFVYFSQKQNISPTLTIIDSSAQLAQVSGTLNDGLIAHYKFDEGGGTTAGDSAGSNTGTLVNGPVWVSGKIGNGALQFDGVNDYVNCGNNSSVLPGIFSFSAWVKLNNNNPAGVNQLIGWGSGTSFPGLLLNFSKNRPLLYLGSNNYRYFSASSPTNVADTNWHHYVFIVTGNTLNDIDNSKLYVDGKEQDVFFTLKTGDPSTKLLCRLGMGESSTRLNGVMDDVRIYNRALSLSEILQLYNLAGNEVVTLPTPQPAAPVDVIPPALSNIQSTSITTEGVVIKWNTDELSDTQVEYGLDTSYGKILSDPFLITSHSQNISNLSPDSLYHFRVKSKDLAGNQSVSADQIFRTRSNVTPVSLPVSFISKNIIENSGFEVAAGSRWGYASSVEIKHIFDLIDTSVGYNSRSSLKLSIDVSNYSHVLSKIYRLKPNTDYTVSFYMKGVWSNGIRASLINTFSSTYGGGDSISGVFNPEYTSNNLGVWKRYSFTGKTNIDPAKSSYQLSFFKVNGTSDWNIWIDDVQVEEGAILTDYSPASLVEAGMQFDSNHKDSIFFIDEPITVMLNRHNFDTTARQVNVKYEIYDYLNRLIKKGNVESNLGANSLNKTQITLNEPLQRTGAFRVLFWVDGLNKTQDEINFSVVQRPITMGIDELSIFGTHLPSYSYFLSSMQKIGVKWNRTLSPGREFRWSSIEPVKGNFIWKDDEIDLAMDFGITILASLGSELVHVPVWARDLNGLPNVTDWDNFVYAVADHYKDKVKYWEIWNEPDTEGGLGARPDFYAGLLRRAYIQIKRANPNAKVIGMVNSNSKYIDSVYSTNKGIPYFDIMSHHSYPGVQPNNIINMSESIWKKYNVLDRWNTETGIITKGFPQTPLWEDQWNTLTTAPSGADYRSRADTVIQNFAITIGGGMQKYFYYDARNTGGMDFYNSYSLFEHNGSLRPVAVAYSTLAYLFEHAVGQGSVAIDPGVISMLFNKNGQYGLIMWVKNLNTVKLLKSNLSVRVFDTMGNEITNNAGVKFGSTPIYIIANTNTSREQLLQGITIFDAVDTTAPYLSVVTLPTGTSDSGRIDFRWFAMDDITYTQRVAPYTDVALSYSYKLEGYDNDWSTWKEGSVGAGGMWTTYRNIQNGSYVFKVKGRDAAGNESVVSCGPINVGIVSLTLPTCNTPLFSLGSVTSIPTPAPITPSIPTPTPATGGGGGGGGLPSSGSSSLGVSSTAGMFTPTVPQNAVDCVPSTTTVTKQVIPTNLLNLSYGLRNTSVLQLQNLLIQAGYLAQGYNTSYFGPLTRDALNKYKLAPQIQTITKICSSTSTTNLTSRLPKSYIFTTPLKLGSTGTDVKYLQIFLNDNGFTVSTTGIGSKGNESTYFGPATHKALIKYQEYYAKDILTPSGLTKGTGYFGPATIRRVNMLAQ